MYYFEEKQIEEIYVVKHRHDSDNDFVDYDKSILDKTLSPFLFYNDTLDGFLNRSKRLVAILFDNANIIKNFRNYMVDKYYYKQKS